MNKYNSFENYIKEFPDEKGYFGEFGGSFVAPELIPAFIEADNAYDYSGIRNQVSLYQGQAVGVYVITLGNLAMGQCTWSHP